jgi:alpha-D-ribose 1-methylphosphonate 5-triphosphate diphosphatase
MRKHNVDFEEAQRQVAVIAAERELIRHNRDIAIPWLTQLAKEGSISLIAHDPASEEDIAEATTWNASIAEFPTTVEAARAAHAAGMRTVCGAPNVLRGGSHSGNVSAAELISLGLCDGLSSDYLPFAMLGAVGILVSQNVCTLPQAVHLVTAGPATTMNLLDRGTLEIGKRADLTICSLDGALPKVLSVISATTAHCTDALVNGL